MHLLLTATVRMTFWGCSHLLAEVIDILLPFTTLRDSETVFIAVAVMKPNYCLK
jgi:hypothetical protein